MSLSELISMLLEPIANEWEGGMEVNSTGDFVSKLDILNSKEDQKRQEDGNDHDKRKYSDGDQNQEMNNEGDENISEGWKTDESLKPPTIEERDENLPDGLKNDQRTGDIRHYGKKGEKTKESEKKSNENIDKEELTRIGRMKMIRNKW